MKRILLSSIAVMTLGIMSLGVWSVPVEASYSRSDSSQKRHPNALTQDEVDLLQNLGEKMDNAQVKGRLESILQNLAASPKLKREDTQYLLSLAESIEPKEISRRLHRLISRHK